MVISHRECRTPTENRFIRQIAERVRGLVVEMSLAEASTAPDSSSITRAGAFEILDCRRRRQVLRYLLESPKETVKLYDLTRQIAAWENDEELESVTSDQRMRVYTALRQSHLPKMDDKGVLEFDADRGTVTLTDEASKLAVYMYTLPHREVPWSRIYLGVGLFGLGLLAGVVSGLSPFVDLPPDLWMGTITVIFVAVASVHVAWQRRVRAGGDAV
jgi:hypothetical protein